MAHFYESLSKSKIDLFAEESKLESLFSEEKRYYYDSWSSLARFIDEHYFRRLELSTNYINLSAFLSDSKEGAMNITEGFIYYCEALLSVLFQFFLHLPRSHNRDIDETVNSINKVIDYDLNKLSLTKKSIETEEFGKIITIIPKDELLENVLQEIKAEDVKEYLIEYRSSHNDGNVKAKEEILKLLATHVEGITKQKKYRDLNERLFKDADFLYNNLNIRHNQEVKDVRFYNATLADREDWLDLAYRETLLVFNSVIECADNDAIEKKKVEAGLK